MVAPALGHDVELNLVLVLGQRFVVEHGHGDLARQRGVDFFVVAVEFLHQNAIRPRPAGQRFDPRRDPRTEKPGRKQRRKAYPRVMEFFGKSV